MYTRWVDPSWIQMSQTNGLLESETKRKIWALTGCSAIPRNIFFKCDDRIVVMLKTTPYLSRIHTQVFTDEMIISGIWFKTIWELRVRWRTRLAWCWLAPEATDGYIRFMSFFYHANVWKFPQLRKNAWLVLKGKKNHDINSIWKTEVWMIFPPLLFYFQ